jgi:hypothetical protein
MNSPKGPERKIAGGTGKRLKIKDCRKKGSLVDENSCEKILLLENLRKHPNPIRINNGPQKLKKPRIRFL